MGTENTVSLRRFLWELKTNASFQQKDKHCVHKRIIFMRRFFCAPITNVQTDGWENTELFSPICMIL